jgi:hypothetical protein
MAANSQVFTRERLSHKAAMGAGRQSGTHDIVKEQTRITKFLKNWAPEQNLIRLGTIEAAFQTLVLTDAEH